MSNIRHDINPCRIKPEGKETEVTDILGKEDAKKIIRSCLENYIEKFCK